MQDPGVNAKGASVRWVSQADGRAAIFIEGEGIYIKGELDQGERPLVVPTLPVGRVLARVDPDQKRYMQRNFLTADAMLARYQFTPRASSTPATISIEMAMAEHDAAAKGLVGRPPDPDPAPADADEPVGDFPDPKPDPIPYGKTYPMDRLEGEPKFTIFEGDVMVAGKNGRTLGVHPWDEYRNFVFVGPKEFKRRNPYGVMVRGNGMGLNAAYEDHHMIPAPQHFGCDHRGPRKGGFIEGHGHSTYHYDFKAGDTTNGGPEAVPDEFYAAGDDKVHVIVRQADKFAGGHLKRRTLAYNFTGNTGPGYGLAAFEPLGSEKSTGTGKFKPLMGYGAFAMWGPLNAGVENDKHKRGVNADGEEFNCQHIHIYTKFNFDRKYDGRRHVDPIDEGQVAEPPGFKERVYEQWRPDYPDPYDADPNLRGVWDLHYKRPRQTEQPGQPRKPGRKRPPGDPPPGDPPGGGGDPIIVPPGSPPGNSWIGPRPAVEVAPMQEMVPSIEGHPTPGGAHDVPSPITPEPAGGSAGIGVLPEGQSAGLPSPENIDDYDHEAIEAYIANGYSWFDENGNPILDSDGNPLQDRKKNPPVEDTKENATLALTGYPYSEHMTSPRTIHVEFFYEDKYPTRQGPPGTRGLKAWPPNYTREPYYDPTVGGWEPATAPGGAMAYQPELTLPMTRADYNGDQGPYPTDISPQTFIFHDDGDGTGVAFALGKGDPQMRGDRVASGWRFSLDGNNLAIDYYDEDGEPDPGGGGALLVDGSPVGGGGGLAAASTTEVLTGTSATKAVTPDALAALWEKGADIASATPTVGEGGFFHVTGTTTITGFTITTDKAGRAFAIVFDGALQLTHNGTSFILPTGGNITAAAGDVALFRSEGGGNVRCVAYMRADGRMLGMSNDGKSLVSAANYAAMRALLDLEAGTDFYSITAANAAFPPQSRTLTAGEGLSGGGDLSAARTFDLDFVGLPGLVGTEDSSADLIALYSDDDANHIKLTVDDFYTLYPPPAPAATILGATIENDETDETSGTMTASDLQVTVEAKAYSFDAVLVCDVGATSDQMGIDFAGGTATVSAFHCAAVRQGASDGIAQLTPSESTSPSTELVDLYVADTHHVVHVYGTIKFSGAGSWSPRFRRNSGASARFSALSRLELTEINSINN